MSVSVAGQQEGATISPSATARRHRRVGRLQAVSGAVILGAAALIAMLAPVLTPADPAVVNIQYRLRPPFWEQGGSTIHLLGTDHLGRDVLGRVIYGTRVSLLIGAVAVIGSGMLGVGLGLVAGYYKGVVDDIVMRLADIQQAFPYLALAIAVVAVLGPGLTNLILVLAVTGWILYARVVRAEVLRVAEQEFIEATRAIGASDLRVMLRHILPHVCSSALIVATFSFAYIIMAEASLTFLGLGVDPTIPSWGVMLSDSRNYLQVAWWYPTFPGLALLITVMGANLLGDGLRDLWDPRLQTPH